MPLKTTVFLLFIALLASCSIPVKESQRDQESTYRGFWGATYLETRPRSGSKNCWNMAGPGSLEIAGGRVVASVKGYDLGGFVDETGKVSAELSLKQRTKFILIAQLDASTSKGTGKLIHTFEHLGHQGCASDVELTKSSI